jgi:hypothetical protein
MTITIRQHAGRSCPRPGIRAHALQCPGNFFDRRNYQVADNFQRPAELSPPIVHIDRLYQRIGPSFLKPVDPGLSCWFQKQVSILEMSAILESPSQVPTIGNEGRFLVHLPMDSLPFGAHCV